MSGRELEEKHDKNEKTAHTIVRIKEACIWNVTLMRKRGEREKNEGEDRERDLHTLDNCAVGTK